MELDPKQLKNLDPSIITSIKPPSTHDELWDFVHTKFGVAIPRKQICTGHCAPFDAFAEAYFAYESLTVWVGSRGSGKCMASDDVMLFPDGEFRTWGDCQQLATCNVFTPGFEKLLSSPAYFSDNGIQDCIRITLESGLTITRTNNHPLFSGLFKVENNHTVKIEDIGFKQAQDITPNDVILTPDKLLLQTENIHNIDDEAVSLLGLLLGDGCSSHPNAISFTSTSETLNQEFDKCLEYYGGTKRLDKISSLVRYGLEKGSRLKKIHPLWKLFESFEILGKRAEAKHFPKWVWKLPNRQLALLLNRLLATDGYIKYKTRNNEIKGDYAIEFMVVSKSLRDNLAWAMHRLGIPGISSDLGPGSYRLFSGERKFCQPRYKWRPVPHFAHLLFEILGPILGKEDLSNNLYTYLKTRKTGQHWRKESTLPTGFFWQKVKKIEKVTVSTTSIYVPQGNVFCGPVVEHNTFLLALLSLTEMVTLGASVALLGGSGEQSARVHAYLTGTEANAIDKFWGAPEAPRWMRMGKSIKSESRTINGGYLKALMASQQSIRGLHPHRFRLDEVDVMDQKDFDAAMGCTLSTRGVKAQTVASSTHHNPDGVMTELMRRKHPTRRWCYKEIIEPHGWLDPTEIERKKREVSAEMFRVEYCLGEPRAESRAIKPSAVEWTFDPRLGEFNGDMSLLPWEAPGEPEAGALYGNGADWAKTVDYTVLVTIKMMPEPPHHVVAWQRVGRLPWPTMVDFFNTRVERYRGGAWHDITGVGAFCHDYLTVASQGFDFRQIRERTRLIGSYINAIELGHIKYPRIQWAYEEHKYATWDDLYGSGHLPDSIAAGMLAWAALGYANSPLIGRP